VRLFFLGGFHVCAYVSGSSPSRPSSSPPADFSWCEDPIRVFFPRLRTRRLAVVVRMDSGGSSSFRSGVLIFFDRCTPESPAESSYLGLPRSTARLTNALTFLLSPWRAGPPLLFGWLRFFSPTTLKSYRSTSYKSRGLRRGPAVIG